MMFILYGTKNIYKKDVMENGITHQSAAYFLIPAACDEDRLRLTMMCSVYHAIGLLTLNRSIVNHEKLSISIREDGGITLTVFAVEDFDESYEKEKYFLGAFETYPYAKVRNTGAIPMRYLGSVDIQELFFDDYMEDDSQGLRFFQKPGGKVQYVKNCNMNKLSVCCANAARLNIDILKSLLGGYR